MSKDITEDILLKSGFHLKEDGRYLISPNDYVYISLNKNRKKKWLLMVTLHCFPQLTIIRNIKQFNKFMKLTNIDFRLKEER